MHIDESTGRNKYRPVFVFYRKERNGAFQDEKLPDMWGNLPHFRNCHIMVKTRGEKFSISTSALDLNACKTLGGNIQISFVFYYIFLG